MQLAGSWDDGATFDDFITVTDRSWDPLINAPHSHGDSNLDFIGEYFGLDADEEDFALLWTDTRTGVQELFFDRVATKRVTCPHVPELVGTVLGGSLADGTLFIIVGGHLRIVPPRGPLVEAVNALIAFEEGGHAPPSARTSCAGRRGKRCCGCWSRRRRPPGRLTGREGRLRGL